MQLLKIIPMGTELLDAFSIARRNARDVRRVSAVRNRAHEKQKQYNITFVEI
jgi:hypothetical protein